MPMPNLEDEQDEWQVEEVCDKQFIKDTIHYLVKWAGWSSEYNSYKSVSHLAKALKVVAAFKQKLKHKKVFNRPTDTDDDSDVEKVSHKCV